MSMPPEPWGASAWQHPGVSTVHGAPSATAQDPALPGDTCGGNTSTCSLGPLTTLFYWIQTASHLSTEKFFTAPKAPGHMSPNMPPPAGCACCHAIEQLPARLQKSSKIGILTCF